MRTGLLSLLQNCTFDSEMGKSTNIAIFLVFIQYQHQLIIKDCLLSECLKTSTGGAKIFGVPYLKIKKKNPKKLLINFETAMLILCLGCKNTGG